MVDQHVPTIPEHSILLHVGLPKTGTTALQHSAARQREALLELGVRYPGDRHNHGNASCSVAGRRRGWHSGPGAAKPPTLKHWDRLVAEVAAETERRIFVSHEFFAEYAPEVCQKVADDLTLPIHVVFTMRNQPSVLASSWQEYVKSGFRMPFDEWLEGVLRNEPGKSVTPSFQRRLAQAGNVRKWMDIVGDENVSVVVLDPDRRALLTNTFESLLGLPPSFLAEVALSGGQANRSFSFPEVELVRAINSTLLEVDGMTWKDYRGFYKYGGVERLLAMRTPGKDETRIVPPRWAVEESSTQARERSEEIVGTGVRVIGDIENLWKPIPSVETLPNFPTDIPLEIARELTLGMFSAATGRGPRFDPVPEPAAAPAARPPHMVVGAPPLGLLAQARATAAHKDNVRALALITAGGIRLVRGVRRKVGRLVRRRPRTPDRKDLHTNV